MKISCKGFTGELIRLEACDGFIDTPSIYNITIYDAANHVSITCQGVKLDDIKLMVGTASIYIR